MKERERRKELRKNAKESDISTKGQIVLESGPQHHAGLRSSYKDIKSMLFKSSGGSASLSASSEVKNPPQWIRQRASSMLRPALGSKTTEVITEADSCAGFQAALFLEDQVLLESLVSSGPTAAE